MKEDINPNEWDFSGLKTEAGTDSGKDLLGRVCFWEYGRECKSLIDKMAALKRAVASFHHTEDEEQIALLTYHVVPGAKYTTSLVGPPKLGWVTFLEQVDQISSEVTSICGRFDWGIFCSSEFPSLPWLSPESRCPIKANHRVLPADGRLPIREPHVWTLAGAIAESGCANADGTAFADELHEVIESAFEGRGDEINQAFHVLMIPDRYFDQYDTFAIEKAIRRYLQRHDRRALKAVTREFDFEDDNHREHPFVWLKRLAIMRLLNVFTPEGISGHLQALDPAVVQTMQLSDIRKFAGYRQDAGRYFRVFFEVPHDEFPIHWNR